jgi:hypothetical protein
LDEWPPFDVVIGNPPYIRQELWRDEGTNAGKALSLHFQNRYQEYLAQFPHDRKLFQSSGDLYRWFFLQATLLLKPGGRLTFITSNSWLNTEDGLAFRHFLTAHFEVLCLMESVCERWFAEAAVNPVIVILKKRPARALTCDQMAPQTRMIRLKKRLAEIMPDPSDDNYWPALHQRIEPLMHGGTDWADVRTVQLTPPPTEETAQPSSTTQFPWSFHLRAPKALSRLMEKPACWTSLHHLATVRYPIKTGINRFFYVTPPVIQQFGIEPEYLHPALKSTKSVTHYRVAQADLNLSLFCCPLSTAELEQLGHTGALAYIRWGETQTAPTRQKRRQPVAWAEVASVRHRKSWYQLSPLPAADLVACRFFDRRYFFSLCEGDVVEDQTFYGIRLHPAHQADKLLVAALLNSTLSYLLLELLGRTSLGEGALQFSRADMARLPAIDPAQLNQAQQQAIQEAFQSMLSRPILPITQEVEQPDRRALDRAVLSLFSPEPEALAREIQATLIQRAGERWALASRAGKIKS